MSKEEQFEHIENKIRETIQNNPPVFDENAWAKMEALLDKEEKKPKPFFWWILLPFLIAGGAYIFYIEKKSVKHPAENISHSSNTKRSMESVENLQNVHEKNTAKNITPADETKLNSESTLNKTPSGNSKALINNRKANINIKDGIIADSKSGHQDDIKLSVNKPGHTKVMTTENSPADNEEINAVKKNIQTGISATNESSKQEITKVAENKQDSALAAVVTDKKKEAGENTPAKKKQSTHVPKKSSPFYFLASVGPDIGSVKLFSFDNSKVTAKYGVGIGYQLGKKFSLQTGFYAGKKKYIAGPEDYHTKYNSNNYKITWIDADCMVYDIPLTVRYDFLTKSSISYYATIGVSSYLMKKEDYNIYYLDSMNYPNANYKSFTGNRHLFSNMSIGAGIEKRISSSLSLQVEPSVSIPLSGVGQGKVKLYSTAIMLGIKYIPFKK